MFFRKAAGALRFRTVVVVVVGLGVGCLLPSLRFDFDTDDWFHLEKLDGSDRFPKTGPLGLYSFGETEPARRLDPIQGNALRPWWTQSDFHAQITRPLAGYVLAGQARLFGHRPLGFHVCNLLFAALFYVVCAGLAREAALLAGQGASRAHWGALLTGLLLAPLPALTYALVWASAQHIALASACALGAVWQLLRSMRSGASLVWMWAFFALGLLVSELTLGALAWIFGGLLLLGPRPLATRLVQMLPGLVMIVAYSIARNALGYGTRNGGAWVDPSSEPRLFLAALVERLPGRLSLLSQGTSYPLSERVTLIVAGLTLIFFAWRASRSRMELWMAAGTLFAIVPGTASPNVYTLMLPAFGASFLLAQSALDVVAPLAGRTLGRPARIALAVVLVPLFCLRIPKNFVELASVASLHPEAVAPSWAARIAEEAEVPGPGDSPTTARVLLLNSADFHHAMLLPFIRHVRGLPYPRAVWPLLFSAQHLRVTRTGPATLEVQSLDGPLGGLGWFRSRPFAVGERYAMGTLSVRVDAIREGAPDRISATIDVPLDDKDVWLVAWDGKRYRRLAAPAIGASVELAAQ